MKLNTQFVTSKSFIAAAMMLAAATAAAAPLTPDQALSRLKTHGGAMAARGQELQLAHTVEQGQEPCAYVFNEGDKGFMVLSADDAALPVLGYCDNGTYDDATAPANLKWWLGEYARQIAWARQHPRYAAITDATVPPMPVWDDVAPKCTTNWDQDAPYNDYCPFYGSKHSYTGCVATAIAQIMNYHQWPLKATGSVSYRPYTMNQTLKIDFDTLRLEWDKMLPVVTKTSPAENRDAVANLMKGVGYGCEMVYSSFESGAMTYVAARGLINYFGYNKGLLPQKREWHTLIGWHEMVYNELVANGPVYYDGAGEGGGHAFVCDGYRASDGFFHFNWGWGGMSDGYFSLEALSPSTQGAGGVSHDYSWDQSIIQGFKPDAPGSEYSYEMATLAGMCTPWDKVKKGEYYTVKGYDTFDGFGLYSVIDADSLLIGVKYVNQDNDQVLYGPQETAPGQPIWNTPMTAYTREQVVRIYMSQELPDGTHWHIYPVYKLGKEKPWRDMKGCNAFKQYIDATVKGDSVYFDWGKETAQLRFEITDIPDYFTSRDSFSIVGRLSNPGTDDFVGTYCGVFMNVDDGELSVAAKGHSQFVCLRAGETRDVVYRSIVKSGDIADGHYGLCMGNSVTGDVISLLYDAYVGNRYGSLIMSYFNFAIADRSYVDAGNMQFTMDISCPQGTYDGPICLVVSSTKKPFNHEFVIESPVMNFTAVEERNVSFSGVFKEGVLGNTYYTIPAWKNADGTYNAMSTTPVSFTVAKEAEDAGVDRVGADDTAPRYYNLQGIEVAAPVKGQLYIERRGATAAKVVY